MSDKRPLSPSEGGHEDEERRKYAASGDAAAGSGGGAAAGGGAENPHANITLRCLLGFKEVGIIIGRGGSTISQIREQSGARVAISDHAGMGDRLITVTGNRDTVARAYATMSHKIAESNGMLPTITLRLAVSHTQAGAIIGRQGAKIKEIREATGANVQLEKDPLPGLGDRCCIVQGPADAVAGACSVIAGVLTSVPASSRSGLQGAAYNPSGAHAPPAMGGGMYNGYQGRMSGGMGGYASPSTHQTILSVPGELIGAIIGKGGSSINHIRSSSQANIKIGDGQPTDPQRTVTISGSMEACQMAAYLIQLKVAEEMNKLAAAQASAGAPPS